MWLDNKVFIGGGDASIERESAVAAACGSNSSAHGFNIPLADDDSLHDGQSHQMHVYMITGDGRNPELNNSPVAVRYPGSAAGSIDYADISVINGWACDKRFPDDEVTVQVWRGNNKLTGDMELGSAKANIVRESAVATACGSNHSAHGFSIDITPVVSSEPSSLNFSNIYDGNSHDIHVYVIGRDGAKMEIYNSPVYVKYPGGTVTKSECGQLVSPGPTWVIASTYDTYNYCSGYIGGTAVGTTETWLDTDGFSSGTVLTICSNSPIPSGWKKTNFISDYSTCSEYVFLTGDVSIGAWNIQKN